MMQVDRAVTLGGDRMLSVQALIAALLADARIRPEEAEPLRHGVPGTLAIHPLVLLAEQEWTDARAPHRLLDLNALSLWLAEHAGLPYLRIDPLQVDVTAVTAVMSVAYARRYRILPVRVEKDRLVVATAEPFQRSWEAELSHVTGLAVERVITNPLDIQRYLTEFYSVSQSIKRAGHDAAAGRLPGVADLEQLVELGQSGRLDANDQHVVHIVDWLLQYAFEQRASDIHIEPRRDKGNIRFRIDGILHLVYAMPAPVMAAVTSRFKVLGRMDVVERRRPQDGRIKTRRPDGEEVELRLSTMPTAFGEKLVLRIFNPALLIQDFSALGFSERDVTQWDSMVARPHGIILVTGPTGSGKTTTLYSTLRQLATPELNVCTIEDPIEMVVSAFNQMQTQHNIGLDFATGVRTLLRQDPDIIMIGEIRDRETAEMAVQAALTGHLVLSTLHTNDAASAITRLLEIGVPAYLLNATLLGVLAQRLVRVLCPHCKQATEMEEGFWKEMTAPWRINSPGRFHRPVGCDICRQTGYHGRTGVYELLGLTREMRAQLGASLSAGAGADARMIRERAIRDGMMPLRIAGARKVHAGVTTFDEVLRVIPPDDQL